MPDHVILDARYSQETAEVNRQLIAGRDAGDFLLLGEAGNDAEISLVGERLDVDLETAVTTQALAGDVALAAVARSRLWSGGGFILIPPNCGVELWDVIQVTDAPCAQTAAHYRVAGIRLDCEPAKARFQHRLILCAR